MRSLSLVPATVLLGLGVAACGSAVQPVAPTQTSASASARARAAESPAGTPETPPTREEYATVDRDKDNDNAPIRGKDNDSAPYDDKNNNGIFNFGHAAGPADDRAVTALIKRYYTAALREDGAHACSMLYVRLAESVVEDHGRESAGPRYLSQGTSCPAVMRLLFKHYHGQLAAELPLLRVARVRLVQRHGLAILRFGALPERQISVRQQAGTWKLATIFDSALP
jgi:hypothetical protein